MAIDNSHNRRIVLRYYKQKLSQGLIPETDYNYAHNVINAGPKEERAKLIRETLSEINKEDKMKKQNVNSEQMEAKSQQPKQESSASEPAADKLKQRYEKKLKQAEKLKKIVTIVTARIDHADAMKAKAIKEKEIFSNRLQKVEQEIKELEQKLQQSS